MKFIELSEIDMVRLIHDAADAANNVLKYANYLSENAELRGRISQHRAWYATWADDRWQFGPSKFVGYHWESADQYIDEADQHDGRETERAIQHWSEEVHPNTNLGRELRQKLTEFLAAFGKKPSSGTRIRVFEGPETGTFVESKNEELVDLLLHVANKLPSSDRQALRAGIRL